MIQGKSTALIINGILPQPTQSTPLYILSLSLQQIRVNTDLVDEVGLEPTRTYSSFFHGYYYLPPTTGVSTNFTTHLFYLEAPPRLALRTPASKAGALLVKL